MSNVQSKVQNRKTVSGVESDVAQFNADERSHRLRCRVVLMVLAGTLCTCVNVSPSLAHFEEDRAIASAQPSSAEPRVQLRAQQESAESATVRDPRICQTAPRGIKELVAVTEGTPGANASAILGTPERDVVPRTRGVPADPEVVQAVTATAEELVACRNAGDLPRLLALYSDRALTEFLGGVAAFEDGAPSLLFATPVPLPQTQHAKLESIDEVRLLPDGRVSAITQVDGSRALTIFVKEEGRYLYDGSYALDESGVTAP